ncbi:hypothetical protein GCM10011390_41900 [Aureimonas endophytica]|uniref:PD-(D/E)XK nuclease superfamily protein n=1 Tax=Aureimonas endophytica TaxID=2027858 RepID=A0A916ZZP0_9HYPH|nr:oxidoreductase [Aureimonas endophytica]GGE18332.1 hypothetical protein GCM10011390_41900 [Aureimonas endophytica]
MVLLPQTFLSPTITAIDESLERRQRPRHQRRLSGSMIGRSCERSIWYQFRWAYEPERHSGRMLRLFQTGHLEEPRAFDNLRAAGVRCSDRDPETGDQWTWEALDGHFVVKADGRGHGFVEAWKAEHVIGIKTHNDKSFLQLTRVGVAVAKPEHVVQAQAEMHCSGIHRFFYYAKNKNDDAIYGERIRYDATQAIGIMAKVERILHAVRPPAKVSDDADDFRCRFCSARSVCHEGVFAPRNCRTCLHSTPVMGGEAAWHCEKHGSALLLSDQEMGCPDHLFIPELVPGDQIDVSPDESTVTYRMPDGSSWIDGGNDSEAAA